MPSSDPTLWASMPLEKRLEWLLRFQRMVAAAQPRLCQLMEEEVRKPVHEGLMADVASLLAACKWLHRNAPRMLRERTVGDTPFWLSGTRIVERRRPVGRVGIIATWNYPVQLLGIQLIQALVAGNTVVVKPSERAPRTQTRLMEIAIEAGLPEGTLTWVGATREAGANMLATQRLDHVVFTGSTEVGQRIAQSLAKTMTPATLELSGRDSAFVLDDADPKKAAKALWAATNMNAGQTCMGPRRALVMPGVYDRFVEQLAKLAVKAQPRDMIDEQAAQRCRELVSRALASGSRDAMTLAGKGLATPADVVATGAPLSRSFRPTVLVHCDPNAEVVEGKHFGPLLAVVKCANLDEALAIHRRCDQHLTASVFTKDARAGDMLAQRLGLTNVMVNDCIMPTAHPGVAIGGEGLSGTGLSRGEEGLLGMTRPMYVSFSARGIASLAKTPPAWQVEHLAKFIRWWYGAGKLTQRVDRRGPSQAAMGLTNAPAPTSNGFTGPNGASLPVLDELTSPTPMSHPSQRVLGSSPGGGAGGQRMSA